MRLPAEDLYTAVITAMTLHERLQLASNILAAAFSNPADIHLVHACSLQAYVVTTPVKDGRLFGTFSTEGSRLRLESFEAKSQEEAEAKLKEAKAKYPNAGIRLCDDCGRVTF